MTNKEKGDRLEEAVRIIESTILQSFPGYSEANFEIASKKIVSAHGVRHEIDLFVRARMALGYEAIFIFECRNRAEKVSKNDIIVFSEKVKVSNAACGYFVAKSFTEDALAQIALDTRIKSLIATEVDPSSIEFVIPFRTNAEEESYYVSTRAKNGPTIPYVAPSMPFAWGNERTRVGKFIAEWRRRALDLFPSATMPEGKYPFALEVRMMFGNYEAYLAGVELSEFTLSIEGIAVVERATLVSAFDVESRGRTVRLEFANPLSLPGGGIVSMERIDLTIVPSNP